MEPVHTIKVIMKHYFKTDFYECMWFLVLGTGFIGFEYVMMCMLYNR